MDNLKIYVRLSDLLYKDMLGLADEEEKRELDTLLVTCKLKGLDRLLLVYRKRMFLTEKRLSRDSKN